MVVVAIVATGMTWLLAIAVIAPQRTAELPWVASMVHHTTTRALLIGIAATATCAVTFVMGTRRTACVLVTLSAFATVVIAAPIVQLARLGAAHGDGISLVENLSYDLATDEADVNRSITYATVDGEDLELDVWIPGHPDASPVPGAAAAPRRPAVVRVHGGGWVAGRRGHTTRWSQFLNDHGYAVFDIDYRLATATTPRWNQSAGDVLCAVGWVKAHAAEYGIDPDRIALQGESAGGELILQAAYGTGGAPTTPSCPTPDPSVRAVVAVYPGTDFDQLWQDNTVSGGMQLWVESYLGGSPEAVPDRYRASSPIENVGAGVPPTLLLHGDADRVSSVEQTHELADRLDRAGVPHESVTLPLMDHGFDLVWSSLGTQVARGAAARFLDEHTR